MEVYQTKFAGTIYTVSAADFGDPSSAILFDGEPTEWQVADFSHSPEEAMERFLIDLVVAGGESYDRLLSAEIDAAVEATSPGAD